jgi:hypothetical protein
MAKLVYGIFRVGAVWKFYQDGKKARQFDHRLDAVGAAQKAVREAMDSGLEVECYLQELDGELRRADPLKFALNGSAKNSSYRAGEKTPPF